MGAATVACSQGQLAGAGQGVAPLQGPILPLLCACNGSSWLLGGDPVPGLVEGGAGSVEPHHQAFRSTDSAEMAQGTNSRQSVSPSLGMGSEGPGSQPTVYYLLGLVLTLRVVQGWACTPPTPD